MSKRSEYNQKKTMFSHWILMKLANNEPLNMHEIEDAALDFGLVGWDAKNDKFKPVTIENDE